MEEKSKWTDQLKQKLGAGIEWCQEHKEILCVFVPMIGSAVVELAKIGTKRYIVKEERRLKENFVYDASNRHYFETKRKLTSKEWLMFDQRHKEGFSVGEILEQLGVLK